MSLNKVLYLLKICTLMKKKVLSVLSLSVALWMNAQEKDSLNQKKIEEVVITGQSTCSSPLTNRYIRLMLLMQNRSKIWQNECCRGFESKS